MEESKGTEGTPAETEERNLTDVARDIVAVHDARAKIVGEIIDETHQMMANFKMKRERMAQDLQRFLAKGESLRKKDFEQMMAGILDAHAKREREVQETLERFRTEEEMVAKQLRELLAKGEEVRIRDFKKMMYTITRGQEERIQAASGSVTDQLQRMQGEVHTMLDNFKKERQSIASAWHETIDLLQNGSAVESKPAANLNESVTYAAK